MKSIIYFLLINSLLFIQSCVDTSCPPDKKIGDIKLSDTSLMFFPYDNNDLTLVFKDSAGNEISFKSKGDIKIEELKLAVKDICSELKYDGRTSFEYIEGQYKSTLFFTNPEKFSFTISLFTEILDRDKRLFYDKLVINLSSTGYIGRGEIITDYRGNDSFKDKVKIDYPMKAMDSVVLNNKVYRNIYATELFDGEQLNRQVYFSKEKGLVGFKLDSTIYNLDRIE